MMKTIKDSVGSQDGQCSYSRRKAEKQTKIKFDESTTDRSQENSFEHQKLVDRFVQDVIEKAKAECMRQCNETIKNGDERSRDIKKEARAKDHENGRVTPEQSSKKSSKEKQKRRHHYKYSDPVDEQEISEYEQQDAESLLQWNPNFGNMRKDRKNSSTRNRYYSRTLATCRRFLGCCFGKT